MAFALGRRGRPLMWLLLVVALVHGAFFGFHYASETRYIVEVFPPVDSRLRVDGRGRLAPPARRPGAAGVRRGAKSEGTTV